MALDSGEEDGKLSRAAAARGRSAARETHRAIAAS